jgi:hypothetical protein
LKNHKKRLYRDYVQKKKTSELTRENEKIKDHSAEFVKFKLSDEAKKRSETNKANASLKKYHHITGGRGNKSNRLSEERPRVWQKTGNSWLEASWLEDGWPAAKAG